MRPFFNIFAQCNDSTRENVAAEKTVIDECLSRESSAGCFIPPPTPRSQIGQYFAILEAKTPPRQGFSLPEPNDLGAFEEAGHPAGSPWHELGLFMRVRH